jgi:hypothetical protein
MGRARPADDGGMVFHVLNRANARATIFEKPEDSKSVLSEWPVPCPRQWRQHVNQPQSDAEILSLRRSVNRGSPFGESDWTKRIVKRLAWRPQFAHADVPSWSQAGQTVSDTFARSPTRSTE